MKRFSLSEAISLDVAVANRLYAQHVNPAILELFRILGLADLDIVRAEGMSIFLRDGSELLDFTACLGVAALGHNHPRVIAAEATCHREGLIDAIKVAPVKLQGVLANNLCSLLPEPLRNCFFTVSGSEAVEAALKLAERLQGDKKTHFITTHGAYHGKTHGSLSLTTSGGFRDGFLLGIPQERVIEVPFGDLAAIEKAIGDHPDGRGGNRIIALIVEPVQGQSLKVAPAGYLQRVIVLSREHGIVSIVDEVKSGMGRTGSFCAFERESAVPDVVTLSKALGGGKRAMGVMVTSNDLFRSAYGSRHDCALHTTTFGGLGETCAVAIEALNTLVDDGLLQNCVRQGAYLRSQLERLQAKHPERIAEIRGIGLLQGIRMSFPVPGLTGFRNLTGMSIFNTIEAVCASALVRVMAERHRILTHFVASDPDVLHLTPALTVTSSQIDRLVDALDEVLARGLIPLISDFVRKNLGQLIQTSTGGS